MDYTVVKLYLPDVAFRELMMSQLVTLRYDSFEETETGIEAYILADWFDPIALDNLIDMYDEDYEIRLLGVELLPSQNWNEEWERNFEPVEVGGHILVKAPFHHIERPFTYTIVIEPKMAFGTGHHETTHLLLEAMVSMDLTDKNVLDFGCGTGILAIFAAMRGAAGVLAIDNDELAVENTNENKVVNETENITVLQGDSTAIPAKPLFNLILANINRSIILESLPQLIGALATDGELWVSGILTEDKPLVLERATVYGLQHRQTKQRGNWLAMALGKAND